MLCFSLAPLRQTGNRNHQLKRIFVFFTQNFFLFLYNMTQMGFYPITALFFSHCTFQSLFVLLPLASGLLFLCEPTFQYLFGLFSRLLFNKYIGPKILLFKYSGGKLLAFCPPPIDKPQQATFACWSHLYSSQHHIPVNFCAVVTVHRQVHPIRPPHRVAAGFINSS